MPIIDRRQPGCASGLRRAAWPIMALMWWCAQFDRAVGEQRLALQQPQAEHRVTGTLSTLDLAAGKGMVMTDLGKPIFFLVERPELFSHLSIGDRVTVQLDEEGRAVKIIEASPAEMHEPPPAK